MFSLGAPDTLPLIYLEEIINTFDNDIWNNGIRQMKCNMAFCVTPP